MRDRSRAVGTRAWLRTLPPILCAVLVTACGNVTGGGANGDVDTYMSGNASRSPSPTPSPAVVGGPESGSSSVAPVSSLTFEGEVTATSSVEISLVSGPTADLTPTGPVTVTADLQGMQEPAVSSVTVPAGRYVSVRMVFTQVSANVTAQLDVGGVPFTGPVTVDLSGGSLEVVRMLDIDVPDGGKVGLLIDLNADAWVPLVDVGTGTVDPADFAAAVSVVVR